MCILIVVFKSLYVYAEKIVDSGNAGEKNFAILDGSKLEVERFPGSIYIYFNNLSNASVSADVSILPFINVMSDNGLIKVNISKDFETKTPVNLKLNIKNISSLSVRGSSNVYAFGMKEDMFKVKLSGSSSFSADGQIDNIHAEISGSGSLDVKNLSAKKGFISVYGAGEAAVYVTDSLQAKVDGAGDIICYGNPKNILKELRGAGDVKIID